MGFRFIGGNLKMQYMGDSDWWNARFKERNLNIMMHEKLLEQDFIYFPMRGH